MANTKHSVAREIVIDRLLHKRRGYSLQEMLEIVNEELERHGFREVSLNTIRNDIENIQYLYRQKLDIEMKNHCYYYRYASEDSTIFNNVLTFGELQQLHSALMSIRFVDPIQGTLMYQELSDRMSSMLDLDNASDPIVIYKKIPSKASCKKYRSLYQHIRTKTPILVTRKIEDSDKEEVIVAHPYFIMFDCPNYYLLCHDGTHNKKRKILIKDIKAIHTASETEFIPNTDYEMKEFYTKHLMME